MRSELSGKIWEVIRTFQESVGLESILPSPFGAHHQFPLSSATSFKDKTAHPLSLATLGRSYCFWTVLQPQKRCPAPSTGCFLTGLQQLRGYYKKEHIQILSRGDRNHEKGSAIISHNGRVGCFKAKKNYREQKGTMWAFKNFVSFHFFPL